MPKPLSISDLSKDEHVEEAIRPGADAIDALAAGFPVSTR